MSTHRITPDTKNGRRKAQPQLKAMMEQLNLAIDFHQKNQNDPYSISVSVIAALTEVRDAVRYALNK